MRTQAPGSMDEEDMVSHVFLTRFCCFVGQSKEEVEPEKPQSRYNLRRRKEETDGRSAQVKAVQELHQWQEKDANMSRTSAAAAAAAQLDFGGKLGRLKAALTTEGWSCQTKHGSCFSQLWGRLWLHRLSGHAP